MAKFVCNLTWQDAPHLSDNDKEQLLSSYSPHERDARSKGLPQLGSGAIYPVVEDEIVCDFFDIPLHWPRAYGMDVGWKKTAAVWGAYDRASDTWYLYSEYYKGYAEPSIHADGIKSRGQWINGVIDSAAHGASQADGVSLMTQYTDLGLNLCNANKAVEAGILECYQRFSSGRLKIFRHLQNLLSEFRVYRRDQNGHVAQKQNDHLMDAMRYLMMSGQSVLELPPSEDNDDPNRRIRLNIIGRNGVCGY